LFLAILVLFLLIHKTAKKELGKGLAVIAALAALNIMVSVTKEPSFFKWIKIFELFCLAVVVAKSKELKVGEWIIKPLAASLFAVCVLGILQVFKGGSLGGWLYFLGERAFNNSTPGIALTTLAGRELLRAYSVFSHPNSLAGFVGAGALLILPFLFKSSNKKLLIIFLLGISLGFLATFSLAASLCLVFVVGLSWLYRKTIESYTKMALVLMFGAALFSLSTPFFAAKYANLLDSFQETYARRLDLAVAAGKMLSQKPILGQGLNNFVTQIPKVSVSPAVSWWLQPVHNIYLLTLTETGLLGLIIFLGICFLAIKKVNIPQKRYLVAVILFVVTTGLFDHYWLTLQQNQLLLAIIFGLAFKNA
jgi:O-antigen ligase